MKTSTYSNDQTTISISQENCIVKFSGEKRSFSATFPRQWMAEAFYKWVKEICCFDALYEYVINPSQKQLATNGVRVRLNYGARVISKMKLAEWKKDGTNAIDARIPDEVWMNGITSKITWWK